MIMKTHFNDYCLNFDTVVDHHVVHYTSAIAVVKKMSEHAEIL